MRRILFIIVLLFGFGNLFAQEDTSECKVSYSMSADFVSRYVWRGMDCYNSPAIQPYGEVQWKFLVLGTWGSFTTKDYYLQETHTFLAARWDLFSITAWDYFFMNMDSVRNKYYNYTEGKTGHDLSVDIQFNGTDKFPLKLLASANLYGADTEHSMYYEATWTFMKEKQPLDLFIGFTPAEGWYGDGPGVVNAGVGMYKTLKINDDFEIPSSLKFMCNPQKENVYLVVSFTL